MYNPLLISSANLVNGRLHELRDMAQPEKQANRFPAPSPVIGFGLGLAALSLVAGLLFSGSSGSDPAGACLTDPPRYAGPREWKPAAQPRAWRFAVLHHTATAAGSVNSIDRAHRERVDSRGRKWKGIGYHFVIGNGQGMADGKIEPTFRWRDQIAGAHAGTREHNDFGIGICLVGNFEETSPTKAQLASLRRLLAELCRAFDIDPERILFHRDIKTTACPGKHFPKRQQIIPDTETKE